MKNKKEPNNNKNLYNNVIEEEIAKAIKEGRSLTGKEGILTPIIKRALEASLEGEIESYLKEKEDVNRRNGKSKKKMKSTYGSFELETPRDRNGSFEPQIVKKRQTILTEELDEKIIKLFSLGMSYEDISSNIQEIYGIELSPSQITAITDRLIPIIKEWQNRPLEKVYPIMFLDGMYSKAREENRVITKVVYNVIGINTSGYKDVLGSYIAESEGANFWLSVLTDLHHRGVEDVVIACIDGLKGFPEAIHSIFPKAEIQLCVIHQIRNTLKYISYKDKKEFIRDLKMVYQADTKEAAENNLLYLSEKWERKYPIVIKSWQDNWELLSTYFKYNKRIRQIIYTTNIIEGFHRVVRKFTKTKGAFTSEMALMKMVYCGIQAVTKKWTVPLQEWALTLSQLDIMFPGRLMLGLSKKFS
jgi:putative transposase